MAERALPAAAGLARHDGVQVILLRAPVAERNYLPAGDGYGLLYPDDRFGAANDRAVGVLDHPLNWACFIESWRAG